MPTFAMVEPTTGSHTTKLKSRSARRGNRYVVNGQKGWIAGAALRSDAAVGAYDPGRRGEAAHRRPLGLSRRFAPEFGARGRDPPDRGDDQPQYDRGVLRQSRSPARKFDRRGRQRLPPHPRRHERRAHPRRTGMHRRRPLAVAEGVDYAKERVVFDRPIGQNQGVQFLLARAYAELEAADMNCRRAAAAPTPIWQSS